MELGDHDLASRLAALDEHGIGTAVVSLQPTLGLELLDAGEREALANAWEEGILAHADATSRIVPLAAVRPRDGFAGLCIGARSILALDDLGPLLDALRDSGGLLFVHPEGAAPHPGAPAWWPAAADYTAQMQTAYLFWLAHGQERWPEVPVVFAILAGGGPIQLERLASRGVDVRSALHPNLYFDTASYGRRGLELVIQAYGVEQLVYGSDMPVVDPLLSLRAVREFGTSVERVITVDNPNRLLP